MINALQVGVEYPGMLLSELGTQNSIPSIIIFLSIPGVILFKKKINIQMIRSYEFSFRVYNFQEDIFIRDIVFVRVG